MCILLYSSISYVVRVHRVVPVCGKLARSRQQQRGTTKKTERKYVYEYSLTMASIPSQWRQIYLFAFFRGTFLMRTNCCLVDACARTRATIGSLGFIWRRGRRKKIPLGSKSPPLPLYQSPRGLAVGGGWGLTL